MRKQEELLNSELHDLEIQLGLGSDVKDKYDATNADIENINHIKARCIFVLSNASWVEDNEKNTKFFLQMEKRNYNSKYIKSFKDESGNVVSDPTLIIKLRKSYYKNLYTANTRMACQNCPLFDTNIPHINKEEKESCEKKYH